MAFRWRPRHDDGGAGIARVVRHADAAVARYWCSHVDASRIRDTRRGSQPPVNLGSAEDSSQDTIAPRPPPTSTLAVLETAVPGVAVRWRLRRLGALGSGVGGRWRTSASAGRGPPQRGRDRERPGREPGLSLESLGGRGQAAGEGVHAVHRRGCQAHLVYWHVAAPSSALPSSGPPIRRDPPPRPSCLLGGPVTLDPEPLEAPFAHGLSAGEAQAGRRAPAPASSVVHFRSPGQVRPPRCLVDAGCPHAFTASRCQAPVRRFGWLIPQRGQPAARSARHQPDPATAGQHSTRLVARQTQLSVPPLA